MKLHIFNPEHDLALAFGSKYFTAPHAGRQLRSDLGFLPALWADEGDYVWVEDVDNAKHQLRMSRCAQAGVTFVSADDLRKLPQESLQVEAWGWDAALVHQLVKAGLSPSLLPTDGQLSRIRRISNRKWSASRLGNTGVYCKSEKQVWQQMAAIDRCVLKAPWSSSGRGVRYAEEPDRLLEAWVRGVVVKQRGVMVEPYYNKVRDFGMEFESLGDGSVRYCGLSVFDTFNGTYQGNLLASEADKISLLSRYGISKELEEVRKKTIGAMSHALRNIYVGPFGVDMMVYAHADGTYALLPCVELNLRRTMGHVALSLTRRLNPDGTAPHKHMRIEYDGRHYHFRLLNTNSNALNTCSI